MKTSSPVWLSTQLEDESVTDICINGPQTAFIDRGAGLEALAIPDWSSEDLRDWVLEQLAFAGKSWDARHPFVDAALPSGHRLHVAFQSKILVSLRRLPADGRKHELRWRSSSFFPLLADAVRRGDSVLISGATGSGKTTLANDLLAQVPPHERIIALEDTAELSPNHPCFATLLSRPPNADGFGEITIRTLLRQALRMRPDRIILGECRGGEVLDLLQALNTGHRGALATLHANSARDALRRAELLCLLASAGSIPVSAIRELLATGLQWIAQVRRNEGKREITEVWRIEGREGDTILMRAML